MGKSRRPLTYEDRRMIEVGLNRGDRISAIARTIGRTAQTVSDEIRRNGTDSPTFCRPVQTRNICKRRRGCEVRNLCGRACLRPPTCSRCREWKCNALCPDFETEPCERLLHAPFSCNSCPERYGAGCSHPYSFYEARQAQEAADRRRREARLGIDLSAEEFAAGIEAMAAGLRLGQSPAHIIAADASIPFSKSTFYRLVDTSSAGGIIRMDLPKAVRYRPRARKAGPAGPNIPRELLRGRTYEDFMALDERVRENAVEMDTVKGRQGRDRKCILTLQFKRLHLQLYVLLDDCRASSVVSALDMLEALLGRERYRRVFGLMLTDRGAEFSDVLGMEGEGGAKRGDVYFCDSRQSQQKPHCERNHEELRRILPKGRTDFDALTERDMARCMSHVNSYRRSSADWFAPIDLARGVLPPELLEGLGVERVEPKEVNLTPYLVPHAML